jgi:hypothetical protein
VSIVRQGFLGALNHLRGPLNTLLFCGCLVHWPLERTKSADRRLASNAYGPIREIHSFGEMFQIIEILRGQRTIPREFRALTHMTKLTPIPRAADFGDVDVVLIEPSSPIELSFRGVAFNRMALNTMVQKPAAALGKDLARHAAHWIRHGLVGMNEEMRAQSAAELVKCFPGDSPEDELRRAVILEARSSRADVLGGFRKMQELVPRPIGIVSYVFRYMPDGRVVSWPAGFREEVLDAASQLGLPVFDPVPLVEQFGIQKALGPDLGHYSDAFMPAIGRDLVTFAESIHKNAFHEVSHANRIDRLLLRWGANRSNESAEAGFKLPSL